MERDDGGTGTRGGTGTKRRPFTSREVALLGLMAALWGVIEITVGGMIKGWHVPFSGAFLATFGVVVLLIARASVPRRWSSLLVGLVAAGVRFASGFGGAMFAALGIVAEALIVELVLSVPRGQTGGSRMSAGILAVLWALAHPFVVQGYMAGLGPAKVYAFTIGLIAGESSSSPGQVLVVILFLAIIHIALGACAVLFVDRIVLAPLARAHAGAVSRTRSAASGNRASESKPADSNGSGALAFVLAVLSVLVIGSPGARADGGGSSLDGEEGYSGSYTLPELRVIGSRLTGPYSVYDLLEKDLLNQGAEDLAEALDMVPGIDVRTDSRGEPRLTARGLAEREMVILVDGVPISDPYTGAVNTSLILVGALGTVRVTRGPAVSVYGANAMGGIVEVTTVDHERSGLAYMLSKQSDGGYSGYVAGGGRVAGVHLAGGIAGNGRSGFSLPKSYSPELWEDGGKRDHTGDERLLLWGRGSWDMGEALGGSLSLQVADATRDVPASTTAERPRFWNFPFWRETRAVGSLAWRPSSDLLLQSSVFLGTNNNDLEAFADFERTERTWFGSVSNRTYGGYLYSEYRGVPGHRVFGGLNVRKDLARIRSDIGEEWLNYDAATMSMFGQDIFWLGDKNRIAIASNADFMVGEGRSLVSVNPQVAWTRRLPAGMSVRLLGAVKTRFPTLKEWFSAEIGNPDLEPERCVAFEAELTKRVQSGSKLSVLAYSQRVDNMIVTAGKGDPARNLGAVDAWGAELGASLRLRPDLDIRLALAMTSARDVENEELVPLIPRTMSTLALKYAPGKAMYVTKITRTGCRAGLHGEALPSHVVVDFRTLFDSRWGRLFAGVRNLFDVLYEDEEGFPQPGRSFEVGVMRELYR